MNRFVTLIKTTLIIVTFGVFLASCASTSNDASTREYASTTVPVWVPEPIATNEIAPATNEPITDGESPTDSASLSGSDVEQLTSEVDNASADIAVEANSALIKTSADSGALEQSAALAEANRAKSVRELNHMIKLESFSVGSNQRNQPARESYRVGPDDVLEVAVFQVEELNRKVRISGDGYIMVPLLGGLSVEGMTTTEVESLLTEKLGKDFLHDPQVSVFVDEFRSHQVAVLGAVEQPNIYTIRQPRTILHMLAEAGGLSEKAGSQVQVRRQIASAEADGNLVVESFIIDLDILLKGNDSLQTLVLRGGDGIVVPESGSFFVEGAIKKPGAYDIKGDTNVLKALSMAGGILYETSKENIEIYREAPNGENKVFSVSYDDIRLNPQNDLSLLEGDIVVVRHSSVKRGFSNFWKGVAGIFNVGYGI